MAERIETAAELDALPVGSVVMNRLGQVFDKTRADHEFQWASAGFEAYWTAEAILGEDEAGSATVLYRPDRDLLAEAEKRGAQKALLSAADLRHGTDLTPTTLGAIDPLWMYDYLARLDATWRANLRARAERPEVTP